MKIQPEQHPNNKESGPKSANLLKYKDNYGGGGGSRTRVNPCGYWV